MLMMRMNKNVHDVKNMTKESKVKGKVWLSAYIVRNTKVQQEFRAEKRKRHAHREFTPSKYDIANRTLYANEIKVKLEAQRSRQLESSLKQFHEEHGIA